MEYGVELLDGTVEIAGPEEEDLLALVRGMRDSATDVFIYRLVVRDGKDGAWADVEDL